MQEISNHSYHVIVNPDDEFVKNLKRRIKDNNKYCVCKLNKKPENKCPCKEFQSTGDCCCGLYIKVED